MVHAGNAQVQGMAMHAAWRPPPGLLRASVQQPNPGDPPLRKHAKHAWGRLGHAAISTGLAQPERPLEELASGRGSAPHARARP